MITALRAQLIVLNRRTLVFGTAAATAFVAVLGTAVGYLALGGDGRVGGPLSHIGAGRTSTIDLLQSTSGWVEGVRGMVPLIGAIALVVAALSIAEEYSHGTWRNLLVRHPDRRSLLLGKMAALALVGTAVATFAVVVGAAVSFPLAWINDIDTSAWLTTNGVGALATTVGWVALATLFFATFGAGLAVWFRSPAPAVGIGLGWALLGEQLVGALTSLGDWLPSSLASGLTQGTLDTSNVIGAIALLAWTAALTVAAAVLFAAREPRL